MNSKQSGDKIAEQASAILRSGSSSAIQKSLAGSVLSQSSTGKMTGKTMETMASNVMNSSKYSELTKSLAASVLSQSDRKR